MLTPAHIDRVVAAALDEDAPWGDVTSEYLIPGTATATADLVAREGGVFSGSGAGPSVLVLAVAARAADVAGHAGAGWRVLTPGIPGRGATVTVLAAVTGPARGVLQAERVGLNFVQRMSGIATLPARYVSEIAGTGARIADTRKTTPGLRAFERAAVRAGGGNNHRFSLSDAVMAKDNHLAVLTAGGENLTDALRAAIAHGAPCHAAVSTY